MALLPKKGLVGFFNDPDDLMHAAAQARDEGFENLDAYTPYPVHGLEHVLGIKRSWIPSLALAAQAAGVLLGFAFQYWTHVVDFPINIGGRPLNAWPAYIVIVFESSVLLSALTNFLSMFVACRMMPNPYPDTLDDDLTNDRFCLVIPAKTEDAQQGASRILQRMGADEIRVLGR